MGHFLLWIDSSLQLGKV